MSRSIPLPAVPEPTAGALARGISATWWYTATALVFFELMLAGAGATAATLASRSSASGVVTGAAGLLWVAATLLLMSDYRHRLDAEQGPHWARVAVPAVLAAAFGAATWLFVGSWELAALPLAQTAVLINWGGGIRSRVVIASCAVLVFLTLIDSAALAEPDRVRWFPTMLVAASLPALTVCSLWWWDVLVALDRARVSEARLAATAERLRVATDVHDLQGHHLQVIALQLELAERLMPTDAAAGMEQLRAARVSVDEARQGTRDLAMRFRSVPLRDEIENARDLLVAAGLDVRTEIAADADSAPASDLGPVIRETTTNILRHGGGRRARLTLVRQPDAWRYEAANDTVPGVEESRDGSGLEGVARRISEAGGTLEVHREDDEFRVVVTVPARAEGER